MEPNRGVGSATERCDAVPGPMSGKYSVSVRGHMPADIGRKLAEAHVQVLRAQGQPPPLKRASEGIHQADQPS